MLFRKSKVSADIDTADILFPAMSDKIKKTRQGAVHPRFERCHRLFGTEGMNKLSGAHVAVFGMGGVGSFAVESLARSGVGSLLLVDFDRVCITNINRQLHAFHDTIGMFKADLMAERAHRINPALKLDVRNIFYDRETSDSMLVPTPDVVIDCIDNVTAKMHLVATCLDKSIPLVTVLGASGRLDPTRIRITSLAETHTDPLGRALRKHIRRKHEVQDAQMAEAVAVFSDEPVVMPVTEEDDVVCGVNCMCPNGANPHHTCSRRNVIYGTASFVTAAFGLAAASACVRMLLGVSPLSARRKR